MPEVNQTIQVSLNANQTIQNALEGTKLENIPTDDDYLVSLLGTADALAVEVKFEADTDVLVQPSVVGNNLRVPIQPDDLIGRFGVTGGSKMFLEVSETGGSAQESIFKLIYTPQSQV